MVNKKVILMILDGWGIPTQTERSAIDAARTPFYKESLQKYSHSHLEASGLAVGLPEGQMGNSEVGHTNLGAGRVVYQNLVRINKAVVENTLGKEPSLAKAFAYANEQQKTLHLIGLVSDGGVHSHINHLKSLCTAASQAGVEKVFVHVFTDGRDTDPKSGLAFVQELKKHITPTSVKIASITGRYYAMDRDKRWERVKLAYDALVNGIGSQIAEGEELVAMQQNYDAGVTDEFLKPIIVINAQHKPLATIQPNDAVLCFNFRTDRGREITEVLTQQDFPTFGMKKLPLYYLTLTNYDKSFVGIHTIFDDSNLEMTLGEVLENAGKTQIRIAETEKYPHVTFFFSGGREEPFLGEKRLLCPSPKVATYDLQPEMSATQIRDTIVLELQNETADFVCLNFANPDMVGHTGVFQAVVKACETVDACAKAVAETGLEYGYTTILIADHGNADYMMNDDGTPNTAHTTNLVPCILIDNDFTPKLLDGKLADIAPTILKLMGVQQPAVMTGRSLF